MGNVNSELREGSDNSQSSYCLYLFSSRNARLSSFSSIVNSQWGQSFVILRLGSTRNASYLWFIKLRGISPMKDEKESRTKVTQKTVQERTWYTPEAWEHGGLRIKN